ncbi:MAG: HAMP domain-containing protein [Acaryochloris sp. SU_5_25]|nr:HAMP domain-containing protein [Acaryochloris sp. SU_5_25]
MRLIRPQISTTSLQFRLTLEVIVLSVLGLCSVALWSGWRMEKTLISAHKQNLEFIAARFPEYLELYSEMGSAGNGLEQTIAKVSTPGLLVWAKDPDGNILAKSSSLDSAPRATAQSIALVEVPAKPKVFQLGDRYAVLCANPVSLRGKPIGKVYLSQDITDDQRQLNAGLWGLLLVSCVAVLVLMGAIAYRIHHTLKPLAHMSQIARAISADDLSAAKLELKQAPDEILGLATAFNEMLSRLSGAWEQQRQFVGNVSHELRTPLTVIIGYLHSLLRHSQNLNAHQQEALETTASEAERTARMLQELLDLARADSGHLHFRLEPVFFNTFVTEIAQMTEKVTRRQVSVLTTAEDVIVWADHDRLEQVLINLIDNAVKYSDPDQPVELNLDVQGQQAILKVRDRGIGIPLVHQTRIFERFYRVDEARTRSKEGTGLGLAIVKSLVEGMNGRITLRSMPSEGSEFTIALPLWTKPL